MATASLVAVLLLAVAALQTEAESDAYHREHVRFHVFTKRTYFTRRGIHIRALDKKDVLGTGFNPDLDTKVLIHGFNNGVTSDSMQDTKNAYFKVSDVNVLVVDWSDLNPAPLYLTGVGNVYGVGLRVAEVLDWMVGQRLVQLDRLHIVGHSLGAHVAGVAAKNMLSGRVARITGLDPASPVMDLIGTEGRLSRDDAVLVDVIHTNAGTLGQQQASGHIDFYPNGGKTQPGCILDAVGACSHGRSYELFAESIRNPAAFTAWRCEDERAALNQRCQRSSSSLTATMGEHVAFSARGAYYLETASSSPFSLN